MVNTQTWLNQQDKQTTHLVAKNQNLTGKLTITNFPNLVSIDCSNNKELTGLELSNLPNLKELRANNCQITKLVIKHCPQISSLNVGNNLLTKTDFLANLNPATLTHLSIHSNNFAKQKLVFLSQFTNLESLYLDNSNEENFEQRIYNHFYGSLEPLQNLKQLQWLSIAKTDIDSGLEYLSPSVQKIGCKKDWGDNDRNGCRKITRELEQAAQVAGITATLNQALDNEPIQVRGKDTWYSLAPWRQARELLGEVEFKKRVSQQSAQAWLDQAYPKIAKENGKNRADIVFLNLNNKNLAGHLDLRDFISLESLSCLGNQLTSLDLSQCHNLTKLNCSGNKFTNTDFLQELPNKEHLIILRINKNEELKENLNFLTPFAGLKELNLEDCPLVGSLEPLANMRNLKKLLISRTHLSKGLEYLPSNCRELYCDYDYQYKSIKIAEELSKYAEDKYYDLAKWREDKQNHRTISVLPLERLFVIRSNLKKFINKWGKETEDNWYERNKKRLWDSEQEVKKIVLSELASPEQFSRYWYLSGVKWLARASAVAGGVLALKDQPELGGTLAALAPFLETAASHLAETLYEAKEKQWAEFIADAEHFLDNYHELLGILEQVKPSKLGIVNQTLNSLRAKIKLFLSSYDEDGNGSIDLEELLTKRQELATDFSTRYSEAKTSQLEAIILALSELEKEVTAYRQGSEELTVEEQVTSANEQDEMQAQQEVLLDISS